MWATLSSPDTSVNADTTISVNNQTQCNILGDGVGHSRFPLQPQHASYSEVTALPGRQSNAHTRFSDTSLTGGSIPVHISFFNDNNNSQYVDCPSRTRRETEDIDDDDFIKYIKKKSKRFYFGGFLPTITREKIERYVNKRGPTVTWVRIWQSRRRPRNVVVRLNVEDNEYTKYLESPSFWPRGITCKPWINRTSDRARHTGHGRNWVDPEHCESSRYIYGRSDVDDYNPYSPLRDASNID